MNVGDCDITGKDVRSHGGKPYLGMAGFLTGEHAQNHSTHGRQFVRQFRTTQRGQRTTQWSPRRNVLDDVRCDPARALAIFEHPGCLQAKRRLTFGKINVHKCWRRLATVGRMQARGGAVLGARGRRRRGQPPLRLRGNAAVDLQVPRSSPGWGAIRLSMGTDEALD